MEIKKGDLFLLGRHRLMCGDALSYSDITKLMNGKVAQMLFTDPPYNVDYTTDWRAEYRLKRGDKQIKSLGGIINDVSFDYNKFLKLLETGIVKGSFYITNIYPNFCKIYNWMRKQFKKEPSVIIWAKNNHTLSRSDYHHLYEIMLYIRSKEGIWNGGRDQKDIWYIKNRPVGQYVHPTQKPLALVKKAIRNNTYEGDIVLDLFGGSGTTLIAAAQLNRTCYMMELDPHYCSVIIQRWENLTGQKAVKL